MKTIMIAKTFLIFLLLPAQASAHVDAKHNEQIQYDTIFRLGRGHIICHIASVGSSVISYREIDSANTAREIQRSKVQKIVYRSGKVEVFNEPLVIMVDEETWESVWVTENSDDVKGLHEVGHFISESASNMRSVRAARRSATIRMQKRAAARGANVLLITKAETRGGFGDMPSYHMEGIGYSFEPPPLREE